MIPAPEVASLEALETKLASLRRILREAGPVLVAYSGGVDSTYLLKVAHEELGAEALGVTAVSASLPAADRDRAAETARVIGARHMEVASRELDDPRYRENSADRCYFCKSELFERLAEVSARAGIRTVVYGAITDDLADVRPGMRAASEARVRAPLVEAGLSKAEIRELSLRAGLPTWDQPSSPCLSSRIPHGVEVTPEILARIEQAEKAVAAAGFRQFRVRYHGEIARLEIDLEEMPGMNDPRVREQVVSGVLAAGFRHVTLDLAGFRSGSLNAPGRPASDLPLI